MIFINGLWGVTKDNPLENDNVFGDVKLNTTLKDWWSTSNPDGTHFANDANANTYNVRFYEDASFARLRDIKISYDFESSILDKLSLSKMKLYLTARNLFTLTKYRGLDPEINNQLDIPLQKEFVFGVNFNF